MTEVLIGTASGCRVFGEGGEGGLELEGRAVNALTVEPAGTCLAVVDDHEIMRRRGRGEWTSLGVTEHALVSLACVEDRVLAGSIGDAQLLGSSQGVWTPLPALAEVPGRESWFAEGPPLHVRSIAATPGGAAIHAAIHVGGIARSTDGGETWLPTIPIEWDVHEVCAHRTRDVVAAATALGLAVSRDAGQTWKLFAEGPEVVDSLAVAALEAEVLFSVQDGPFAGRSQVWRWRFGRSTIEQVRDGLPDWLDGKVDTQHIASHRVHAAIADGGGTLWVSAAGSRGWRALATGLNSVYSVQLT
jgi:hypothetical protein